MTWALIHCALTPLSLAPNNTKVVAPSLPSPLLITEWGPNWANRGSRARQGRGQQTDRPGSGAGRQSEPRERASGRAGRRGTTARFLWWLPGDCRIPAACRPPPPTPSSASPIIRRGRHLHFPPTTPPPQLSLSLSRPPALARKPPSPSPAISAARVSTPATIWLQTFHPHPHPQRHPSRSRHALRYLFTSRSAPSTSYAAAAGRDQEGGQPQHSRGWEYYPQLLAQLTTYIIYTPILYT
jgi:hypothetical protein